MALEGAGSVGQEGFLIVKADLLDRRCRQHFTPARRPVRGMDNHRGDVGEQLLVDAHGHPALAADVKNQFVQGQFAQALACAGAKPDANRGPHVIQLGQAYG